MELLAFVNMLLAVTKDKTNLGPFFLILVVPLFLGGMLFILKKSRNTGAA